MDASSQGEEVVAQAGRMGRVEFVAANPCLFLLGRSALNRPQGPRRTVAYHADEVTGMLKAAPGAKPVVPTVRPLVLAVRKVQENFPSMITVGRTGNNDVVIADVSVSKFHAYFRAQDGGPLELTDAGSMNGTFVDDLELGKNGPGRVVQVGIAVRFGRVDFVVVDAGACWDNLRKPA